MVNKLAVVKKPTYLFQVIRRGRGKKGREGAQKNKLRRWEIKLTKQIGVESVSFKRGKSTSKQLQKYPLPRLHFYDRNPGVMVSFRSRLDPPTVLQIYYYEREKTTYWSYMSFYFCITLQLIDNLHVFHISSMLSH